MAANTHTQAKYRWRLENPEPCTWLKVNKGIWIHPEFRRAPRQSRALWLRLSTDASLGNAVHDIGLRQCGSDVGLTMKESVRALDDLVRRDLSTSRGTCATSTDPAGRLWVLRGPAPWSVHPWSTQHYPTVYQRDGWRCRYCGRAENLTIDHLRPRVLGGGDEAENLVVACRPCNSRKSGRTPEQAGMTLLPIPSRDVAATLERQ